MNVVTLIGNVATDVEIKNILPDKKLATFRLAIDRGGAEGTDFVTVAAWNRQAELCAEYLEKGRRVAVDGRIRTTDWDGPDGEKRYGFEIVARRVEFLGGPRRDEDDGPGAEVIPFEAAAAG